MSSAICPHCGELCLTIRQPRRHSNEHQPVNRTNPSHYALLDLKPVGIQTTGSFDLERVEAVVVFDPQSKKGAEVYAPAYLDPESRIRGHVVHRFRCPKWPAVSKMAAIKRHEPPPKKEGSK